MNIPTPEEVLSLGKDDTDERIINMMSTGKMFFEIEPKFPLHLSYFQKKFDLKGWKIIERKDTLQFDQEKIWWIISPKEI